MSSVEPKVAPPFRTRVERAKLMQFAEGLHLENPVHRDVESARAAGFRDIVAPAGFIISNTVQSKAAKLAAFGIDEDRALAGEMTFDHKALVFAGDELTGQTRLVDVRERETDRRRTFFTLQTTINNQFDTEVLVINEVVVVAEVDS
ncbi:MAG: hypothetical protein JWQ19_2057 [Subtercola sp.]|nr:hypothetical protein [Subtercola sp.]